MSVSPDGSLVLVTGDSESCGGTNDYATVAYDAATGAELWVSRYDGTCSGWDRGNSVAALPDGSAFVVTGYSHGLETGSDYTTVAYLVVLPIDIDIKPENDANPINPRARGVTPVALLGSAEFDVTEVDVSTLRFGPGEAVPAHDLTDGWPYSDPLRDVNSDGFTDLLAHFRTPETEIQCGETEATLTGLLLDGFPIRGTDSIVTVGCRHSGGPSARTLTVEPRRNPRTVAIGLAERR